MCGYGENGEPDDGEEDDPLRSMFWKKKKKGFYAGPG